MNCFVTEINPGIEIGNHSVVNINRSNDLCCWLNMIVSKDKRRLKPIKLFGHTIYKKLNSMEVVCYNRKIVRFCIIFYYTYTAGNMEDRNDCYERIIRQLFKFYQRVKCIFIHIHTST